MSVSVFEMRNHSAWNDSGGSGVSGETLPTSQRVMRPVAVTGKFNSS